MARRANSGRKLRLSTLVSATFPVRPLLLADRGQDASRELLEDERRFVDLSRSPIFLAEEYAIITADDGDSNCAGSVG